MMPPGGGSVYIGNAVTTDREKMQFHLKFALDRALRAEVSLSHVRICAADGAIAEKTSCSWLLWLLFHCDDLDTLTSLTLQNRELLPIQNQAFYCLTRRYPCIMLEGLRYGFNSLFLLFCLHRKLWLR